MKYLRIFQNFPVSTDSAESVVKFLKIREQSLRLPKKGISAERSKSYAGFRGEIHLSKPVLKKLWSATVAILKQQFMFSGEEF